MAKYEKTERLEKVPMEYLWEGLVLSDNLYNYNGSVLLVPSGEVITKSKLDKLINFSDGNNYITTFRGSIDCITGRTCNIGHDHAVLLCKFIDQG